MGERNRPGRSRKNSNANITIFANSPTINAGQTRSPEVSSLFATNVEKAANIANATATRNTLAPDTRRDHRDRNRNRSGNGINPFSNPSHPKLLHESRFALSSSETTTQTNDSNVTRNISRGSPNSRRKSYSIQEGGEVEEELGADMGPDNSLVGVEDVIAAPTRSVDVKEEMDFLSSFSFLWDTKDLQDYTSY